MHAGYQQATATVDIWHAQLLHDWKAELIMILLDSFVSKAVDHAHQQGAAYIQTIKDATCSALVCSLWLCSAKITGGACLGLTANCIACLMQAATVAGAQVNMTCDCSVLNVAAMVAAMQRASCSKIGYS